METDKAIEDIRRTRREISEKHNNDPKRLVDYYQKLDKKYQDRMINSRTPGLTNTLK